MRRTARHRPCWMRLARRAGAGYWPAAKGTRQPPPGLIHHLDRGVQYASADYVARLEQAGARLSMSAVGNPYDNAKGESFFKTLKQEEVYLNDHQCRVGARPSMAELELAHPR